MHKERITVPGTTSVCPRGCIKRQYKDDGGYQILQASPQGTYLPSLQFIEINPFVITNEGFSSFPHADEQCMGAFHLAAGEEQTTRADCGSPLAINKNNIALSCHRVSL